MKSPTHWQVYILQCADGSYYTGVTVDIARRVHEHNHAKLGAKYTRARRPVKVVYSEACIDRSAACKREAAIKKLPRSAKVALIASQSNEVGPPCQHGTSSS
ncbi:GIY-YIG nuclease family protein [Saccharophagus degradans]|nr:GIY-YIG nuclease family protein [Saccharophagus degradans]MDO6422334.1 GIY-YIG nuclease family protein [Saccharophagus degradans]MDO6608126.1 GIY-YIG nuclease family protein [Saccharophagus degradans]WGO99642.1 GIY-YIG nuclease family protein [Saccharophagus degradans]